MAPLLLVVAPAQLAELALREDLFDDFCVLPAGPEELVARLEHLLWRAGRGPAPDGIEHGPLVLNPETDQGGGSGRARGTPTGRATTAMPASIHPGARRPRRSRAAKRARAAMGHAVNFMAETMPRTSPLHPGRRRWARINPRSSSATTGMSSPPVAGAQPRPPIATGYCQASTASRVPPVTSACRIAQRSAAFDDCEPSTPTTIRSCPSIAAPSLTCLQDPRHWIGGGRALAPAVSGPSALRRVRADGSRRAGTGERVRTRTRRMCGWMRRRGWRSPARQSGAAGTRSAPPGSRIRSIHSSCPSPGRPAGLPATRESATIIVRPGYSTA